MLPPLPLLLPLLWAGALTQDPNYWLAYRLCPQQQVTVQEGQCVLVPCEVSYPIPGYTAGNPAYGYWFRERGGSRGTQPVLVATNRRGHEVQNKDRGRFHLLGDPRNYNCSLDIRDAQKEDTGTYYFRVERGGSVKYSYNNHLLSVTVTALTHTPDIHLQGPLQSGRPSNITCAAPWACERGTPPTFSWRGVGLSATGTDSPVLTLSPGPQHHGSNLTCRVTFPAAGVSTETTVRLSVAYAPQNLTIQVIREEGSGTEALGNGSSLRVQEGQSLHLACVVHSSPPATLTWVGGSLTVKSSPSLNPVGVGGTWENSQTLELDLAREYLEDHRKLLCRAQNPLGSQEASLSLSVERHTGHKDPLVPGPAGARIWVIVGALVGAGASVLLAFCLVFFIVRSCRKKGTEAAGSRPGPQDAGRSSPRGHQSGSWVNSPTHPQGLEASPSEEEQELHYANIRLPKASPRAFLVQETSEYSEINVKHGAALSWPPPDADTPKRPL